MLRHRAVHREVTHMSSRDSLSVTAKTSNLRVGYTGHIAEAWTQNVFMFKG